MLRRVLVYQGFLLSTMHAPVVQQGTGGGGCVTFVHQHHQQAEPSLEPVGETAAERGHLVRRAVIVAGQADDECGRLPFLKQGGNSGEASFIFFIVQGGEWPGGAGEGVSNRNANAPGAEVERKQSAGRSDDRDAGIQSGAPFVYAVRR